MPRLRLRTGGRDVVLPAPPGLRRGEGLALVPLADGGAVLLSRGLAGGGTGQVECDGGRGRVRECSPAYADDEYDDYGNAPGFAQRLWRMQPGGRAFERVTTVSRAALRTLKAADVVAVADGNAVLAVSDERIERVPLDGGAPTTVARGENLSLELDAAAGAAASGGDGR
jgi:hypothetical protein